MRAMTPLYLLMTAFICLLFMAPVTAQDNPYQNAGTVTEYDIPITLDSTDTITNSAFDSLMAGSSDNNPKAIGSDIVAFNGAGYSYRIGRVTITMNPLDMRSKESARIKGNTRSYGSDPVFEHEVYRDLIKERVILNSPRTLQYAYSLKLSDWVTREPDMSQPVEVQGADGTISVTYPHIKEVTTRAADSTIDINPDPWGNLEVSVNDESVVVMPQPFAIDADGKRFELAYLLDKEAGTITITGDLTDAKYPVTIDPTERVTNGGFETGDTTGWWKSDAPELIVFSSEPYQGSYYCRYTGNGLSGFAGYTRMYQTIDYNGVPRVFGAVKIRSPNPYNFYLTDGYWDETANYSITFPKSPATGWVLKNATTNRSSTGKIAIWTHGSSSADIDSIRAIGFNTPVVQFTGSPASGTAPLTVYFTDQSTNSPTSWSWNFGDGGTSTAQHPSHTYTSSGTYTVRLTASNAEGTGDPSTKTNYISVSAPLPNAQFTASPTTGTAPLTVYFTDQSTNSPTSWSWNFGDSGTSSAQNPSHTYTSSGTYTVSLTVANAAGSDGETKTGYVVVTAPVSNQATDVAGRSITQDDVALAASRQQLMNYQVTTLYPAKQSDILPRLPNDQIFFFDGHGIEGAIQLNDTLALPDQTLFYGTNDVNSFDEATTSYSNMKLAVFLACKAGGTSSSHGNIVEVIASKGASCVMGWTENIVADEGAPEWSSTFWNRLQDGDSIRSAYNDGLGSAEQNYICQNLYSENSTIWDPACNLTKIHFVGNNGGCSQPLTSVLASQMVRANNQKITTENQPLGTTLSNERKKQIINSISTFTKKPVDDVEYKKILHQPYTDLYHVKAGDSSYWVNANNGRVQTLIVAGKESKTTTQSIDLNQGSRIAESYAKEKYPELWNISEGKEIRQTIKKINNHGSEQTFEYSWQEVFNPSRINSSDNSGIPGPNLVTITISPYTGMVIQYHEWYSPDNIALNLTPSLSETDAMNYAELYFQSAGFENITPDQITSSGLGVAVDENNNQHLTWSFTVNQKDAYNFDKSGFVGIDAHDGEIVWHASIA